ncbi:MAG: hypothetical protein KDD70_16450 [Bdellovibrionales bacterium]|nr:hypothetical protein [Bdellovibrionales bacterium]
MTTSQPPIETPESRCRSLKGTDRLPRLNGESGGVLLEYATAAGILLPIAIVLGIVLQTSSQSRGTLAVEGSQYLIPCNSESVLGNTYNLVPPGANECK